MERTEEERLLRIILTGASQREIYEIWGFTPKQQAYVRRINNIIQPPVSASRLIEIDNRISMGLQAMNRAYKHPKYHNDIIDILELVQRTINEMLKKGNQQLDNARSSEYGDKPQIGEIASDPAVGEDEQ